MGKETNRTYEMRHGEMVEVVTYSNGDTEITVVYDREGDVKEIRY